MIVRLLRIELGWIVVESIPTETSVVPNNLSFSSLLICLVLHPMETLQVGDDSDALRGRLELKPGLVPRFSVASKIGCDSKRGKE